MSFFRHARSIGPMAEQSHWGAEAPLLIVRDESHRLSLGGLLSSRARFRFAGCAQHAMKKFRQSSSFQQTATCGLTGCLSPGVHPTLGRRRTADTVLICSRHLSAFENASLSPVARDPTGAVGSDAPINDIATIRSCGFAESEHTGA